MTNSTLGGVKILIQRQYLDHVHHIRSVRHIQYSPSSQPADGRVCRGFGCRIVTSRIRQFHTYIINTVTAAVD